jgi:outer membrane murein-binding lipoprotein Lpp
MTTRIEALVAFSLVLLASCSSTGRDRTRDASSMAGELRGEVVALRDRVEATCTALAGLERPAGAGAEPAYERFVSELDDLGAQVDRVAKAEDQLRAAGDACVDEWARQSSTLTSVTLKKRSDDRRAEVAKLCGDAVGASRAAQPGANALVRELGDIRTALDLDLTARGVTTLRDEIASASATAGRLRRQLDEVASRLDAVGKALATSTQAPGDPASAN